MAVLATYQPSETLASTHHSSFDYQLCLILLLSEFIGQVCTGIAEIELPKI